MSPQMQAPRILQIPLSTYVTSVECSADRAIVKIDSHRARCAYGHRWVRTDAGWQYVGRD